MTTPRIWSLFDIMNSFDAHALAYVMHEIGLAKAAAMFQKIVGQGSAKPLPDAMDRGNRALEFAENYFTIYKVGCCLSCIATAKSRWKASLLDASSASEIFARLELDILSQLDAKREIRFLRVEEDRGMFVDQDNLFGPDVASSFKSASQDVKEAGNCLAAECNTAAVFHLMRAVEVALRALARDRGVTFANKPIDQQEWGTILGALEGKLKELRLADGKNWQSLEVKDAQIQFYNDTVQELRAFNEAWRRYISHADPQAFYDHDDAGNIMKHVRSFMQKLAKRISETTTTAMYWNNE